MKAAPRWNLSPIGVHQTMRAGRSCGSERLLPAKTSDIRTVPARPGGNGCSTSTARPRRLTTRVRPGSFQSSWQIRSRHRLHMAGFAARVQFVRAPEKPWSLTWTDMHGAILRCLLAHSVYAAQDCSHPPCLACLSHSVGLYELVLCRRVKPCAIGRSGTARRFGNETAVVREG